MVKLRQKHNMSGHVSESWILVPNWGCNHQSHPFDKILWQFTLQTTVNLNFTFGTFLCFFMHSYIVSSQKLQTDKPMLILPKSSANLAEDQPKKVLKSKSKLLVS